MAGLVRDYWSDIVGGGGAGKRSVGAAMHSLLLPAKFKAAMPLLFKPLTADIAQAALETMKGGSSAGKDGMPAELYQRFPEVLVPRMLGIMERFLG